LASPLRAAPIYGQSRLVALLLILMTLSQSASALLTTPPFAQSRSQTLSLRNRATNESSLLECLEVTPPVLSPTDACQQTLMVHTFAYSYGQPFVGQYNPPRYSVLPPLSRLRAASYGAMSRT
jgi:hypothetical protein